MTREYSVTCNEKCAFQPRPLPDSEPGSAANVGSWVVDGHFEQWDKATGLHKGGHLQWVDTMTYMQSDNFTGVAPTKPALCLAKPVRCVAGKLGRLTPG